MHILHASAIFGQYLVVLQIHSLKIHLLFIECPNKLLFTGISGNTSTSIPWDIGYIDSENKEVFLYISLILTKGGEVGAGVPDSWVPCLRYFAGNWTW